MNLNVQLNEQTSETEYDNELENELVKQIVKVRKELNLSQKELADRIGTKQSNISRLESGNYNPSLNFLKKIAYGLGKDIYIEFR